MNKQKISILGCGWLGLPLAKRFIDIGYKVKGSVRNKEKISLLKSNLISPFIVDLENHAEVDSAFFDADILIIAIPYKNLNNFKNIISHIENSPIQNVIYISSTSVYSVNEGICNEESEIKLDHPLIAIENLFLNNQTFKSSIIRFSGLVGPNRNPGNFFKRNDFIIPRPNEAINLIHLFDCIGIIERMILKPELTGIFNAASNNHSTRGEFYSNAIKLNNGYPKLGETSQSNGKTIDSSKVSNLIDFKINTDLLL